MAQPSARAVIASCVTMVAPEYRHKGRLVCELPELPRVVGNEALLGQLVSAVLMDAARALPESREGNEIRLGAEVREDQVVLTVADNGPVSASRAGLHLARALVGAIGGAIAVTTDDSGTVARLALPLAS